MIGVIVGIDVENGGKKYRVILMDKQGGKWVYKCKKFSSQELISALSSGGLNLINAYAAKNEIKGRGYDIKRFENGKNRPIVIIAEIVLDGAKVIGYRVADYNGAVTNVRLQKLLEYCDTINNRGGIPIQNAAYVPAHGNVSAHIKGSESAPFVKINITSKKTEQAKPAVVETTENEKKLSKIKHMFTKEQIQELRLGKQHGVDIRIYGNPKFSAEQMQVIRLTLEDGLNAALFADPEYSVKAMRFFRANLKYGDEIKYYLNPVYTVEQLSELDSGILSGVDISKYSDPKNSPEEMAEIRTRLEGELWKEQEVEKDLSWV